MKTDYPFETVRALDALASSSARDQVDIFKKQFAAVKDNFDRGMQMEIWDVLVTGRE